MTPRYNVDLIRSFSSHNITRLSRNAESLIDSISVAKLQEFRPNFKKLKKESKKPESNRPSAGKHHQSAKRESTPLKMPIFPRSPFDQAAFSHGQTSD